MRQEGRRAEGGQRGQEPEDQADADRAEAVHRQQVGDVQEGQRGRVSAGRRLLLRRRQGGDRVGQFLALRDQRRGQLLAVAVESPPRLPGPLALVRQGLGVPLGFFDLGQLGQVLLPRLPVVDGVEPDVGPRVRLLEQRLRLGLLVGGETVVVRDPLDGLAQLALSLVGSSRARPSASGSMPRN